MNEVSLLFFGQPEKLSSALLLNLNVIEFREETSEYSGLFILENKFGKEVLRKLSLTFDDDGGDWLVYRYLSSDEQLRLKNIIAGRRVYVLLQNYMTLEYFKSHVPVDGSSYFYIVGQNDVLKPMAAVAGQFSERNVLFVKNVKKKSKTFTGEKSFNVPDLLASAIKLLLNPVDEFNILSKRLMHSNQRIAYRFVELLNFVHFIVYMTFFILSKNLGIQLFWNSIKMIGFVRVGVIKSKFFIRHLVLMEFYKSWGLVVDGVNFLIRLKDKVVLNVYYRIIHSFFYKVIHRALHRIWLSILSPLYFNKIRPAIINIYSWAEKWIYYKGVHRLLFLLLRISGFFWEKIISPVYFATLHRIVHAVLKPTCNFMYYRVIQGFYYKVVQPFYYKVIQGFYYKVIRPIYDSFVPWLYYKVIHRAFHRVVKPLVSAIFYHSFHILFHRVLKPFYTFVWYKMIVSVGYYKIVHRFYHRVLLRLFNFLYYNFFQKAYYRVMVLLVYRIWPWVKFNVFIRLHHLLIFKVRHYFLMSLYKTYGLSYDLVMLIARVTKLYLLYPFFKIYWFTSFQYNKRIKKFFA